MGPCKQPRAVRLQPLPRRPGTFHAPPAFFMIANLPDSLVTLRFMPADSEQEHDESSLVERCQDGDREALSELRERNNASLRNILIARGANGSEAEEILAEVWAKCVPGGEQ